MMNFINLHHHLFYLTFCTFFGIILAKKKEKNLPNPRIHYKGSDRPYVQYERPELEEIWEDACLENKVSSNLLIDDLNKYYQLLLEADNFLE